MLEPSTERNVSRADDIYLDNDSAGGNSSRLGTGSVPRRQVRVLIDDRGARYTFPTVKFILRHTKFASTRSCDAVPGRLHYSNLRLHRKILVVDGSSVYRWHEHPPGHLCEPASGSDQ